MEMLTGLVAVWMVAIVGCSPIGHIGYRADYGVVHHAPVFDAPLFEAPTYEGPSYKAPKYEAPTYKSPNYEAPYYLASGYQGISYEAPHREAAHYQAPRIQSATYKVRHLPSYQAHGYHSYEPTGYKAPFYGPVVHHVQA